MTFESTDEFLKYFLNFYNPINVLVQKNENNDLVFNLFTMRYEYAFHVTITEKESTLTCLVVSRVVLPLENSHRAANLPSGKVSTDVLFDIFKSINLLEFEKIEKPKVEEPKTEEVPTDESKNS